MTIARRRPSALNPIAAPMPTAPPVRPAALDVVVPVPFGEAPAPEIVAPAGRLRRCAFRRMDRVAAVAGRPGDANFEVVCVYGDADAPRSLGDISAAQPACDGCTAKGIFRPDED